MKLNELAILASTTIVDGAVPLSRFEGTWALMNLVLMMLTLLETLFLLFNLASDAKQKKELESIPAPRRDFYKMEFRRETTFTMISIPVAVAAVAEYFLTEEITMQMVIADRYTFIMGIFFAIQTALVVSCRHRVFSLDDK